MKPTDEPLIPKPVQAVIFAAALLGLVGCLLRMMYQIFTL